MLLREKLKEKLWFSDVECTIADYILEKGVEIKNESGRHIAAAVFSAPSSLVRMCQKLGFKGYNDFREEWLKEQEYLESHFRQMDANRPFKPEDNIGVIAHKIGALYQETISDTLALLDTNMLAKAVEYCAKANKIFVFSTGAQAQLAETFCDKMSKIGKTVILSNRGDMTYYHACYCDPSDCFILLSYSGETPAVLYPATQIKHRKINTITITTSGSNSLVNMFLCNLFVSTRERLVDQLGNFEAHLTALFVLDLIYAGVFNQNYEENLKHKKQYSKSYERYRKSNNSLIKDNE